MMILNKNESVMMGCMFMIFFTTKSKKKKRIKSLSQAKPFDLRADDTVLFIFVWLSG